MFDMNKCRFWIAYSQYKEHTNSSTLVSIAPHKLGKSQSSANIHIAYFAGKVDYEGGWTRIR